MPAFDHRSRLNRPLHVFALGFLLALSGIAVAIWIAVQSLRDEPLPSLVWAPDLSPDVIFSLGPPVLERLPGGWWWIETTPLERDKLRALGAHLAVAMPTPVARMAGCSGDTPVNPEAAPPRI